MPVTRQEERDAGLRRWLSFTVDEKLDDAIRAAAKKNDRSVSAEIRYGLREYIERQDNGGA